VGALRSQLLGIPLREATFAQRGFKDGAGEARERLEEIGRTFLRGYHAALVEENPATLGPRLDEVERDVRGFAFEGAAMGLALLDALTPWKRTRWRCFLAGPGAAHLYMVHVGMGWALARVPWLGWRLERYLARLDPLLRWLAVDGYGFHEGYFHWPRSVEGQKVPKHLSGYARRVFDQGLGRSLWFVNGADVERIPAVISRFPPARQADLWSGVGLACSYAGGVGRGALEALRRASGSWQPQLAQGAAFAAKARQRAGNSAAHTELACHVIGDMSSDTAARLTDLALQELPAGGEQPSYELWRQRIQAQFAARGPS
jgi:hypothetical protein